ncbi:hypothetical protein FBG13_08635 [Cobetia marina]|jgi:hypothetical protein|uniref:Pentapeptide MXKDX repeat protein n=1 Tax=Cobetia marina TaxID=28258 RepID=A0ABU9GGQ2_COBMA|nr:MULTISPECIES: hypothetical protein [Gammaproteobacteria]AOM00672.1 hypothetical protein BFX80_04375 [Cobetia marina]AZV30755.1 hypothetical protein CU110_04265 [Cobetia sp. ICG0124]MDA5562581.1 hypothetical protein [Cobetia sp. MMG027]MDH2291042.1 hypothetical protein [Cobetia sp. 10Alg 146]MDH2373027.1 hypothetical protein [Cobetia sp. 3AK]
MNKLTAALIATAFALPTAAAYADHHESSNTGSANTGAHSTKVEGGTAAGHEGGMVQDDAERNTESGSANTKKDSMMVEGGTAQSESAKHGKVMDEGEDHMGVSPESGSANTADGSMKTE